MNKASGGDGISAELFQILKDDAVKVLHSKCQQIWKTLQWPQHWKQSVFIPVLKKDNAKEYSSCHTIALTLRVRNPAPAFLPLPDGQGGKVRRGAPRTDREEQTRSPGTSARTTGS